MYEMANRRQSGRYVNTGTGWGLASSLPYLGSHAGVYAQLCCSARLTVSSPSLGSFSLTVLCVSSPSPVALLVCAPSACDAVRGFSFAFVPERAWVLHWSELSLNLLRLSGFCVLLDGVFWLFGVLIGSDVYRFFAFGFGRTHKVPSAKVFQLFAGLYKVPVSTVCSVG